MSKVKFKDLKKKIKENESKQDDYITPKTAHFLTMDIKNKFIEDYSDNWQELILANCTIINHLTKNNDLLLSNNFKVNSHILSDYTLEEIDKITSKLTQIFPPNEKQKFSRFTKLIQFHRRDGIAGEVPITPSGSNISDYAICQLNDDVIVFHLDLNYNLGTTINSMFKKEKLTNPLDTTSNVEFYYKIIMTERMKNMEQALIKKGAQDTLKRVNENVDKDEETFRVEFDFNKDEVDQNDLIIAIKEDWFVFANVAFGDNESLKKNFRKQLDKAIKKIFAKLKNENKSGQCSISVNISSDGNKIVFK
jgi:hypothetical protein